MGKYYFLYCLYSHSFLVYESSIFNQENKFYEKILNELMIILSIAKDTDEERLIHIKEEYCYILFIVEVFSKNLNEEYYFKEPSIKLCFISINNILYNSLQKKTIDIQESEILFEAMRTPINYLSHYVLRSNFKVNFYYIKYIRNLILSLLYVIK